MNSAPAALVLVVFIAVLVRIFWRLVVNLLVVGFLALVFAGIFEMVSMMRPQR